MKKILRTSLLLILATSALGQEIALSPVLGGLLRPLAIAHAGDQRLFIVEQGGRIVSYDRGTATQATFLDVSSLVSCCNERGLLGLAFHPRYTENGQFFIFYTATNGALTVARYRVSTGNPNAADPASASILLQIPHNLSNHNGGQLEFGPDGYLYVGTGDGGGGGDPGNNGQNLSTLLGKILRIDVDSGSPYGIPPSNPFVNQSGARGEIWAWGLRNPWRFSFDRENGDLWIADVGQLSWEEVNLQRASSIGGENYGWRVMEGTHCFNPSSNCNTSGKVLPVIEYNHSGGACSVTGGYRYRGTRWPRLRSRYFYGDFCNGVIWAATETPGGTWTTAVQLDTPYTISSFGQDSSGELYVVAYQDGVVYALSDRTGAGPRRRSVRP